MARLFTSGFELNSGNEFSNNQAGAATLDTVTVRSGVYSLKIPSLTSGAATATNFQYASSANGNDAYLRSYFNVTAYPNVNTTVISFAGSSFTLMRGSITLTTTGTLILKDGGGVQVGSASGALNLSQWYRIELRAFSTSTTYNALIDGVSFASTTTGTGGVINFGTFGGNLALETCTTGVWYFDDIAINDTTGTKQNSFPGSGKVIRLKPRAAGDSNQFLVQTGGTAGAANNFTRVNEVLPDDATTFNGDVTLNNSDMFAMDASNIGTSDTVTLVEVAMKLRDLTADATTALKVQIEKTSAGTITQGAAIIPNSTTFRFNTAAAPRTPLVTYTDPDGAAWTKATLDTMQCGYKITAAGVNAIDVTVVYANVEYIPSAVVPSSTLLTMGVG